MRRGTALIAIAVGLALVAAVLPGCYTINVRCPPEEEVRRPQVTGTYDPSKSPSF